MIGQTFSHYKILQKLGEGGMGVVYKAQDTKLLRPVALKFLSPELTRDHDAKKRFIREARAASGLDHPNIAVVHDVDETADGRSFICMAYYEGQTLATKLSKGSFDVIDAVHIAVQIAGGLESAHDSGIVHRDIKPSNVIITPQGEVKIVDFGLAKLSEQARETKSQITGGTAAYMSPEQILGSEADTRSDLFSLGVVLYETVTGKRPFLGEHEAALHYSIVNSEPIPPSTLRPGISPELEKIILHLLEKDPKKRYQSATDVVVDLKHYLGEKPTARPVRHLRRALSGKYPVPVVVGGVVLLATIILYASGALEHWFGESRVHEPQYIGVVPFNIIANDSSKKTFCDGLFERVVSGLIRMQPRLGEMRVAPASDTRRTKTAADCRALNISLAIESSIQWSPDVIQLTISLTDAEKRFARDSRSLNVPITEQSQLEARIIEAVAQMLGGTVKSADLLGLMAGSTKDDKAHDLWLQARGELLDYTKSGKINNALALFERAIQTDPQYALAYAGLGEAYLRKFNTTKDRQWSDSAAAACSHANALNDKLPEVHLTLGMIYKACAKYDSSIAEFQRVIATDPLSVDAYRELAGAYNGARDTTRAEASYRKAIELSPRDWRGYNAFGGYYYNRQQNQQALAMYNQVVKLRPDLPTGHANLGAVYFRLEEFDKSKSMLESAASIDSSSYQVWSNLGTLYYYDGLLDRSVNAFEIALKLNPTNYRLLGNYAAALRLLGSKRLSEEKYLQAASRIEENLKVSPNDPELISTLACFYADLSRKKEAVVLILQAIKLAPRDADVLGRAVAVYELVGDRQRALDWLAKALENGYSPTPISYDPELKKLRGDPQCQKLMKEAKEKR